MLAGFPVVVTSEYGFADTYSAVGDVDGDGSPEIIVVGLQSSGPEILVFGGNGLLKRTIPLMGEMFYGTAPALADLDGDGLPEIIVQTNQALNVVRGDGTTFPGWPVNWDQDPNRYWAFTSAPVVGDVDGDGLPDIVVCIQFNGSSEDGEVRVYNRNGTLHPRFPKTLKIGFGAVPAIADLDLDGRNEIVVSGDFWNGIPGDYDRVWVFDLGGLAHGAIQWGQFMGGPKHQAHYIGGFTVPDKALLNVKKAGDGNGMVIGPGINCGRDCSEPLNKNTLTTLVATAAEDSVFLGWTGGGCESSGLACTITVTSDTLVTATFINPGNVPLTLATSSVPAGEVNLVYNSNLQISGGLSPYNVSVTKGALPPGLSLGSPVILGTPTRAGTYKFIIQVTDQLGSSVSQRLQIKILKPVAISTKSLKNGRVSRAYNARLAASGGQAPYSWSLLSGTLPDGLSFDASRGSITGTPMAAGSGALTFQVTDALGGTTQRLLTLTIR